MSLTGLENFDRTVHKTNEWLKELALDLGWSDRHRTYHALRTVLHELRDHLTPEEVAELAAQLPMLVRGFYYEGWHPTGKPIKERHRDAFLARIAAAFRGDGDVDPARVTRAVFALLTRRVTRGEIDDIRRILPEELRGLWDERPAA